MVCLSTLSAVAAAKQSILINPACLCVQVSVKRSYRVWQVWGLGLHKDFGAFELTEMSFV